MPTLKNASFLAGVLLLMSSSFTWSGDSCLVAAHRGASGYLPEHTMPAYALAIEQGADYIELDVVLTKDGVPVIRHEPLLDHTTDVASHKQWQDRQATRQLDGADAKGWYVDDFTLAEVKSLRAVERISQLRAQSAEHSGRYDIPTLEEVVKMVVALNAEPNTDKDIGLYIEFKNPQYFSDRGQDITQAVLDVLSRYALNNASAKVLLQSFDAKQLRATAKRTELPLIQLVYYPEEAQALQTPEGIAQVAQYAQGLGMPKYGFAMTVEGDTLTANALVKSAHAAGLVVHIYTFRAENYFLPAPFQSSPDMAAHGDLAAEINAFLDIGIDGFFVDHPDIGRAVCDARP